MIAVAAGDLHGTEREMRGAAGFGLPVTPACLPVSLFFLLVFFCVSFMNL
jgi:hypothetical protein